VFAVGDADVIATVASAVVAQPPNVYPALVKLPRPDKLSAVELYVHDSLFLSGAVEMSAPFPLYVIVYEAGDQRAYKTKFVVSVVYPEPGA
jgi:hypothetical protein